MIKLSDLQLHALNEFLTFFPNVKVNVAGIANSTKKKIIQVSD